MNPLDNYLGIHSRALTLEAQRTELLAANLANVDTPNYKARDIDFKTAMAEASGGTPGVTLATSGSNAPITPIAPTVPSVAASGGNALGATASLSVSERVGAADVKYRVPLAPALDGNTVDEQLEQSAFAENSVRYQATLAFLNSKLRALMTAITGQ